MGRELSRAELTELLAAYALDALDGDERDQVEELVARDADARAEVDSLREAAAFLAHEGETAPEGLWARIEESLGAASPPGELRAPVALDARRARPARRRWLAVAACLATVAVAAIAVLGVEVSNQQGRIDQLDRRMTDDGMRRAAERAMEAPGSHTVRLVSTDGKHAASIVMSADGSAFFMGSDLPSLATGRTYQLWAISGDAAAPVPVSVAVLGAHATLTEFRVAGGVHEFAVTAEQSPGVAAPEHAPVLTGAMT